MVVLSGGNTAATLRAAAKDGRTAERSRHGLHGGAALRSARHADAWACPLATRDWMKSKINCAVILNTQQINRHCNAQSKH